MDKFKFLLLVATIIIATNVANAGGNSVPWCDCHVTVKAVRPDGTTGGGKVYACNKSANQTTANCKSADTTVTILGKSHNKDIFPADVFLAAKPDDGWEFDYWECTKCYGTYNPDTYKGTPVGEYRDLTALPNSAQKACMSKMNGDPNDGNDSDVVSSSGDINAIWIAHFKPAEMQTVKVQSENASLGTANIDKVTNHVGDTITLSAWCGNSNNNPRSENIMFLGWYRLNEATGEKEFASSDDIYTFIITEDNKGTYYARYASGYYFWRIRNIKHNNYLTAVAKYTGNASFSQLNEALNTQMSFNDDLQSSITDAGSMMKIWVSGKQQNTNKEVWDIYVQDEHTNQYYDATAISQGSFLQVTHNVNNTYYINANNSAAFLKEPEKGVIEASPMAPESAKWYLEGMDKDLTTKKNYLSIDPEEFLGPDNDGYYWTTLRVCFNMKYETSEITPYIVTVADANTGNLELTEVTGGIIPEKTCVLLKCKSTDVTRNVMIPTTTSASFAPTGNLLTSSTYYYKDQSVSSSLNLKGIKLIDGRLGFGGNTKTSVDGNRAYLSIPCDVAVPIETTLAKLIASGDTQNAYNITDLQSVDFVENGNMLICKDDNGYANKDVLNNEDYIDLMHITSQTQGLKSEIPETYDQSNWIGLRLPDGATASPSMLSCHLKGVVGRLTNTVNPEFRLAKMPEQNGEVNYTPNVYIAASFNGTNPQTSSVTGKQYFFVQPKPMEIANVEWAQWNGEKFIAPVANKDNPTWNQAKLMGEFEFNGSFLEQGGVFLETGHVYEMLPAIIKVNDGSNYPHVYVLGDVNNLGRDPHKGVEMYTSDGKIYTATVTVNNVNSGNGYFSFTKRLGAWDDIKDYRFGPVAEGSNYYVDPNYLGNELPLDYWSADTCSFEIAAGNYHLAVNLSTKKAVITPSQSRAPGLKAATNGYVVYPLQISKVTEENNGVITALDGLQSGKTINRAVYYNMMGVPSSTPFKGVNIVVTEYNDGSRTAEKVVR